MKRFKLKIFVVLLLFFLLPVQTSHAQMDPRVKVLIVTASYGAAGGTMLGMASMAFGTKARAIFQGASLGLYAGLLFGAYIVIGHTMSSSSVPEEEKEEAEEETPYTKIHFLPGPEEAQVAYGQVRAEYDQFESSYFDSSARNDDKLLVYIPLMAITF